MRKVISNTTNSIWNIVEGEELTVVKEYFYNGEFHVMTKEKGDVPSVFIEG